MRRFAAVVAAVATGLVVAPGVALPSPATAAQTVINGEVIRQDTTWKASGSPYVIRRAVQIPQGVTLTIEPGVRVVGERSEHLFLVAGNLAIQGSAKAPVVIEPGRQGSVIEDATDHDRPGSITISHARISNGRSIFPPGGSGVYTRFILSDSVVRNMRDYSYIWYPLSGSAILRNTFSLSGGFSIGFDARGENGEPIDPPIRVEGNRFLTRSTTKYWIQNWAAYGQNLPVHRNSFMAAGTPSVVLPSEYGDSAIDARNNYWGTTDPKVIDRMILDAQDDIRRASVVEFEPILATAPQGPPSTTPGAPTDVEATVGVAGSVQVSWAEPADRGGRGALTYVVSAEPGPGNCEVQKATTCVIDGLPEGTHTFTVTASNGAGVSAPSEASAAVTVGGSDPGPDPGPTPPSNVLASVNLGSITVQTQGRWTTPDGCGNYVFRFSGVSENDIGTFRLVDVASGKTLDSELTFGTPAQGTSTFTVCSYQSDSTSRLALELDFNGLGQTRSAPFAWESDPAPLPSPGTVPSSVSLGAISARTLGAWPSPPSSGCANYLLSYSGITSDDIGTIRLIDAVRRTVLDSEVFLGRVNNGVDTFTVCSYQVNSRTRLILQADFARIGVEESRNFTWQQTTPPTPSLESLPAVAIAGSAAVSTGANWAVPRSCRDYTYTVYGMPSDSVASVRVINAVTRKVLGSDVLFGPPSSGTGTVFLCPSDVTTSTIAVLQFDLSTYGVVESGPFRFTS
jgi:hypothetical protein